MTSVSSIPRGPNPSPMFYDTFRQNIYIHKTKINESFKKGKSQLCEKWQRRWSCAGDRIISFLRPEWIYTMDERTNT